MTRTEGRQLLDAALKQPGRSQSWLARLLEIRQPAVSQWVRGNSRPEPHFRLALQRLLGIPAESWMTAKERKIAGIDTESLVASES